LYRFGSAECFHIFDEGLGNGGRKFEGLVDHALSSSTKPGGILGGLTPSLGLQTGQGIPGAPQPQAYPPSHGICEWASHTQWVPKQRRQIKSSIIGRAAWSGSASDVGYYLVQRSIPIEANHNSPSSNQTRSSLFFFLATEGNKQ